MMTTHLRIIGVLLMLLALLHVGFPRYFRWKEQLSTLSLINRQMMQVHTFFIALVVFMIGVLSYWQAEALQTTDLGRLICGGLAFFWGLRLFFQLFVYAPALWRGKLFETTVHIAFTMLWLYLLWVYGSVAG
jgi:hypothetical protein